MRWVGVGCAFATAMVVGVGTGHSTPAACAKGMTRAVINGKHVCLKAGQRCKKSLDAQYHRYKFHCHTGRLTRRPPKPPVPLIPVTINLQPVNESGVTGTVTLTPLNAARTRVTIEIPGARPPGALPAHIHLGVCPDAGGIFYGLANVVDGRSETEVGGIDQLRRTAMSVNVHRDEPDLPAVACGDIPRA